ncbi:Adenylate cyclase type 3 [Crenichthys baileyi]|uniref:adenylate cyclase n=1 Tax=Crenichthys baileyi TaxID=28760 RepID=A0AAV9QQC8_9TELE
MVPSKFTMTVMIFIMMVSLYYFSRHVEKLARTLFLWKIEVHEQKEKVYEMRRWNEALVTNMLPEHVARHFLGSKKRDEELYSQSYDEIGVMFASIPNFSDFYTEESINNGGIECLRFLNEIISDFDSLLDEPKFRYITKIKTIGSTYMAASGVTSDVSDGYICMKQSLILSMHVATVERKNSLLTGRNLQQNQNQSQCERPSATTDWGLERTEQRHKESKEALIQEYFL